MDFYGTVAQVIATLFVLLAGAFVYLATALDQSDPKTEPFVLWMGSGVIVSTTFGLGVSLYAAAAEHSSAFLTFAAAGTVAVQVLGGGFIAVMSSFPQLFRR